MDESRELLNDFLNEQVEQRRAQEAMDDASSQEGSSVTVSGTYRMNVDTFYSTKDGFKTFPCLDRSSKKKSLMLVVPLRVIDGTSEVPKGALAFLNIVLSPAPGAKTETVQNIARMAKPKLTALLGHENIQMEVDWLLENLLPKYERQEDKWILKSDHKLKSEVMVKFEDGWYNNAPKVNITSVRPAGKDEHSVSNKLVSEDQPITQQEEDSPDYNTVVDDSDDNINKVVDDSINENSEPEASESKAPSLSAEAEDF